MTKTYITLSLGDIAESIRMEVGRVEVLLLQMIDAGEINASIDEEEGMVSFQDTIDDNSYKFCQDMEGISRKVLDLVQLTEGRIEDLMLDPAYIKRTSDVFREAAMGGMGGMGMMNQFF